MLMLLVLLLFLPLLLMLLKLMLRSTRRRLDSIRGCGMLRDNGSRMMMLLALLLHGAAAACDPVAATAVVYVFRAAAAAESCTHSTYLRMYERQKVRGVRGVCRGAAVRGCCGQAEQVLKPI